MKCSLQGGLQNAIVGEGSEDAARASVQGYFDAVNNKNYDKAFTYVMNQVKTNPVEKQKWLISMQQGAKVDMVTLDVARLSRSGSLKRIVFEADLQTTKASEAW